MNPRPADTKALPFSDAVLGGQHTLYRRPHWTRRENRASRPPAPKTKPALVMDGDQTNGGIGRLTMDDVVSMQIFCTDLKLYETFNKVYKTYFHGDYPARAFVGPTNYFVRAGSRCWGSRSRGHNSLCVFVFYSPCAVFVIDV